MNKTVKVNVNLGLRSYPIYVGRGSVSELRGLLKKLPSNKAFVVADASLKSARTSLLSALRQARYDTHEIPVKAGEGLKNLKSSFDLYGQLLKMGAHRDCVIFALGGGSVGDAAGFIASTYLRGVAWVGLPTTLLAQVDSAIGGKTAMNHPEGKNLIGTFHQPHAVICDTAYLKTLGRREIVSGLGEALKYGLIYDARFFNFIRSNWARALALDEDVTRKIIHRCVQFKALVVARDEFDEKGVREALNFGHTMGHALEKATDYKFYQHGEAVLWGMRFALALSVVRKCLRPEVRADLENFFAKIDLPPWPRKTAFEGLSALLSRDKKIRAGKLHYVLIKNVGQVVSDPDVTSRDLRQAYNLLVAEGAI